MVRDKGGPSVPPSGRPTSNASLMTSPGVKMVTRASRPPSYSPLVFQLDEMAAPILLGFSTVFSDLRSTLCIEKGKVTTISEIRLISSSYVINANSMSVTLSRFVFLSKDLTDVSKLSLIGSFSFPPPRSAQ